MEQAGYASWTGKVQAGLCVLVSGGGDTDAQLGREVSSERTSQWLCAEPSECSAAAG